MAKVSVLRSSEGDFEGSSQLRGWVPFLIWAALLMNLFDAGFTVWWVELGIAEEANLLLRDLLSHSVSLFFATKFSLVLGGLWLLYRFRRKRLAQLGIVAVVGVYYLLMLYHLQIGMLVAVEKLSPLLMHFA